MDKNTRWVFLGFVGLGLLVAWIAGIGFQTLFYYLRRFNIRDYELLGNTLTLASLLGIILTAIVGYILWRNDKVYDAAHEVVEELSKVTWPDSQETQTSTIVVIITTIIIASVLWIFDLIWAWGTQLIYGVVSLFN